MAESSNIASKAREILITASHERLETIVAHLSIRQDTNEFQTALAFYDFFAANFENLLTIKLLKVYLKSSNGDLRSRSIYLLSETLAEYRERNVEFSLVALYELKPILIECLEKQEAKESDIKLLRRIVSFVAHNIMMLDNEGWDELSACIFKLADKEPLKAFHVFIDLPPVYGSFIYVFMEKIQEKAYKVLLNPEKDRVEDWSLALRTVVKMGIQLMDTEMRYDLIGKILSNLVEAASELVKNGMEEFLLRGLDDLERFLIRDKNLYHYNKNQCRFVSSCAFKIRELGKHTKEATRKINRLVMNIPNPDIKLSIQPQEKLLDQTHTTTGKTLSSLKEVLRIFTSIDLDDRYSELGIRRLNVLLSDCTSKKVEIEISTMKQLQPLLMSYLWKRIISESMFKVLGEVVYHVAYQMFIFQKETWLGLREYIASQCKTEFERTVYIFQCLTMRFEDDEFVIRMVGNLLPEISKRLNPPREYLVGNSCWFLAFTGAFCAVIHLIEITSHAGCVKEIALKMVESVKELVERRMEVGFVRRAFRDLESIVKKQLKLYGTSEYKFVKGLLWRLYAIKGMKWESKIVLWRINVIVERGVAKEAKELPKSGELDWINQPEA